MHEVLVNRLGGLSLPRKSVVRLTDRPDMTLDVYRGHKTTIQPTNQFTINVESGFACALKAMSIMCRSQNPRENTNTGKNNLQLVTNKKYNLSIENLTGMQNYHSSG